MQQIVEAFTPKRESGTVDSSFEFHQHLIHDIQDFSLAVVIQQSKYFHVISQIDVRTAAEVEDIITNPPADEPYTHLRQQLIERLSSSEEQRVWQLLHDEELSDRKPSQFLLHLKSLAGPTPMQPNLLRHLWLRRLPPHVQAILTTRPELSLEQLSDLGDRIVEITPVSANHAIDNSADQVVSTNLREVLIAVKNLSTEVNELSSRSSPKSSTLLQTSPQSLDVDFSER
uniref:DUF7041 domain-containing protein n=1 Tax=Trichogramma kaykai TaxID=54128 RepID=A0ABD2WIC7_9HYME